MRGCFPTASGGKCAWRRRRKTSRSLGGVELVDGSYAFDFVEYPVVVVGGAELDVMPYVEVEREVSAEVLGGCLLVVANLHGGERVADLAHVDDVVVEAVGGDDAVGGRKCRRKRVRRGRSGIQARWGGSMFIEAMRPPPSELPMDVPVFFDLE